MDKTLSAGPAVHPKYDDSGKTVTIHQPSLPTGLEAWSAPDAIATVVPGGAMPEAINGIPFAPWKYHPQTASGWLECDGLMPGLDEPPLHGKNGKKTSAGIVVVEPDGRVWVVHPTNGFGGYRATFPKGRVDPGMTFQATAIKECLEESGLHARITSVLGDFERTTTVMRLYLGERIGGSPSECGWESQAVSLVPVTKLPKVLNGAADKSVIAALLAR